MREVRRWAVALLLAGAVLPVGAEAQYRRQWQVGATVAIADQVYAGAGGGYGVRVGRRLELLSTLSGGVLDEELAGRAEVLLLFHLNPLQRGGPSVYGGGGVAVVVTEAVVDERLALLVGVTAAWHRRVAPFLEVGLGGGVRLAGGVRIRAGARR